MNWIKCSERPLFTVDEKQDWWTATEDGDKEFLAAVPTKEGWWIAHCILEDEVGLCIVGIPDTIVNLVAPYGMSEITHWMPLPEPPEE